MRSLHLTCYSFILTCIVVHSMYWVGCLHSFLSLVIFYRFVRHSVTASVYTYTCIHKHYTSLCIVLKLYVKTSTLYCYLLFGLNIFLLSNRAGKKGYFQLSREKIHDLFTSTIFPSNLCIFAG